MKNVDPDIDRDETHMAGLMSRLRDELTALETILPAAMDAQWSAAPVARPREDTAERVKNARNDPTGAIALDADRLRLRSHVVRSAQLLHGGIIAVGEVRRALGAALAPWDGEGPGNGQ